MVIFELLIRTLLLLLLLLFFLSKMIRFNVIIRPWWFLFRIRPPLLWRSGLVPGRDVVQTAERKVGLPHHRSMTSGETRGSLGWDDQWFTTVSKEGFQRDLGKSEPWWDNGKLNGKPSTFRMTWDCYRSPALKPRWSLLGMTCSILTWAKNDGVVGGCLH